MKTTIVGKVVKQNFVALGSKINAADAADKEILISSIYCLMLPFCVWMFLSCSMAHHETPLIVMNYISLQSIRLYLFQKQAL